MKLVSTQRLPEEALRNIAPGIELVQVSGEEALLGAVTDADIIIGNVRESEGYFERVLRAAKRVRWVHNYGAGVESLLCPEFLSRDVVLSCGKGYSVGSQLAEHAFALILALTRGIAICARMKTWSKHGPVRATVSDLRGKTMGLVGFGGVGMATARRALAFEMNVLAVRRNPSNEVTEGVTAWGTERFYDLLERSDIVVVSVPLTSETRRMFNRRAFERMKTGAILVNVGRGEVVETAALVDALREGRLAGAGLDVFEQEPLPDDSPLWNLQNVVITPHLAGASPGRPGRNLEIVLENLQRFVDGRPLLSVVNKTTGY